jgi:hypothetical protein
MRELIQRGKEILELWRAGDFRLHCPLKKLGSPVPVHEPVRENRIELPYEDFTISIINASDLIANKESVGRDQDLVDAKMLRSMAEKG